jgi:mono/diheme cytochrome c family protein
MMPDRTHNLWDSRARLSSDRSRATPPHAPNAPSDARAAPSQAPAWDETDPRLSLGALREDSAKSTKRQPLALAALIASLALLIPAATQADDAPVTKLNFQTQIRPLLESRCIACHGPDEQEGSLRLDSRDAALKGGTTGPAVVPHKPKESLLLAAVLHETKKLAMPPKERLSDADIAALRRWIEEGAAWPADEPTSPAPSSSDAAIPTAERIGDAWHDPRNPIVRIFRGERLDLWSLMPITHPTPPAVKNVDWPANSLDAFILQRVEAANLSPSPAAERRALARRLYVDLTGLPPTYDQVEAFIADDRPDAYEQLVDNLLASPQAGQHMARMWLDVVRYSDSNGFDWDEFRPRAWLFRDYVIRSLNADKPFNHFVTEQLAGDEILQGPPQSADEQDSLIATGYLRIGPQDNSSALFNEQARSRAEWMADLTETTASAFLGLTYSCCRCHDHKYDPLSQADHFRLRAFFEPLRYADDLSIDLASEQQAIAEHNGALDAQIQPLKDQRGALREEVKKRIAAETPESSDKQIVKAFSDEEKARDKQLDEQIDSLNGQRRSPSRALLATDNTDEPPPTHILYQGDYKQPRDVVLAGFVSALDPSPASVVPSLNPMTKGRRLTLAAWITSPDNPLTARVLVNRLWQMHFGRGLVGTPNDFGLAGDAPTNFELIDYLATELVRSDWSIKHVQRLIVTSSTYRQASSKSPQLDAIDPDNQLHARQNLRRLSAEQLRDSLLAVSGLLTQKSSGAPMWPELPPEVLQANPAFLDDNPEKTKGWYPSPEHEQLCRSIFLVQKRTVRIPLLETFDLPENQTSCARRNTSTVAPQAFTLLNSPLATKAAAAASTEAVRRAAKCRSGTPCLTNPTQPQQTNPDQLSAQITAAFQQILARNPTPSEHAACAALLENHSHQELCRALLNLNEFIYLD